MLGCKSVHRPQGRHEYLPHLSTLQIASRENEGTHAPLCEGRKRCGPVPDPVVLCEDYPFAASDLRKPLLVSRFGRKVIIVNFYGCASLAKRCGNFVPPQGSVEEKNMLRRLRVRTELPLGFPTTGGHSPLPISQ